jgi:hypothetical protein
MEPSSEQTALLAPEVESRSDVALRRASRGRTYSGFEEVRRKTLVMGDRSSETAQEIPAMSRDFAVSYIQGDPVTVTGSEAVTAYTVRV